MPRSEQLINRIRDALSRATDGQAPDGAAELAEDYALAVMQTNDRLTRCLALVRQGLRSEAIHQAELPPAVLEEAATLDFPQRRSWVELCQRHDLDVPAEVNVDAVIEIDEAFPREVKLEELLTRHRRLALMRAPLPPRIRVLRRLAQVDLDNTVWAQDLAEFERARHKQLIADARLADQANDAEALQALYEEVTEPWQSPPPKTIVDEVSQLVGRVRGEAAAQRMAAMTGQIEAAHRDADADRLGTLLHTYDDAARLANGTAPAESDAIGLARAWLHETLEVRRADAHAASVVQQLRDAIDTDASADELVGKLESIHALGRDAPAELEQIVRARRDKAAAAARNQRRARLLMAGLAVAAVAGAVGFFVWTQQQATARDAAFADAQQRYTAGDVTGTKAALDAVAAEHPTWFATDQFQALHEQVAADLQAEADRATRFAEALAALEAAGAYEADDAALDRAAGLAATDAERAQLGAFREQVEAARAQSIEERNAEAGTRLAELEARYRAVAADDTAPEAAPELLRIRRDAGDLRRVPDLRASLHRRLDLLLTNTNRTLELVESRAGTAAAQRDAVASIGRVAGDPATYFKRVNDLLADPAVRSGSLADDLMRVAASASAVSDLSAWAGVTASWDGPRVLDADEAERRAEAVAAYLSDYPAGQHRDAARLATDYLAAAERALDPDQTPTAQDSDLWLLLRSPLVDGLNYFELNNGGRWYTSTDEPATPALSGTKSYRVFLDADDARRGELTDRTLRDDAVALDTPQPAGETGFALQAWAIVRGDGAWETLHLRLLQALMQADGIDPVHRASLARELVSLSLERDWPAHDALRAWDERLAVVRTTVNWLDPTNTEADAQRIRAIDALATAPDLDALLTASDEAVAGLPAGGAAQRVPIAALDRAERAEAVTPDAGRVLLGAGRLDGSLWVMLPDPDRAGAWRWTRIATVRGGVPRFASAAGDAPRGALVFWEAR